jgi:hypothetical protein
MAPEEDVGWMYALASQSIAQLDQTSELPINGLRLELLDPEKDSKVGTGGVTFSQDYLSNFVRSTTGSAVDGAKTF